MEHTLELTYKKRKCTKRTNLPFLNFFQSCNSFASFPCTPIERYIIIHTYNHLWFCYKNLNVIGQSIESFLHLFSKVILKSDHKIGRLTHLIIHSVRWVILQIVKSSQSDFFWKYGNYSSVQLTNRIDSSAFNSKSK